MGEIRWGHWSTTDDPHRVLEVDALTRSFDDVTVVDSLDLHVDAGECVVLLGHNGSGKTTALHCIAGWLEPTGGRVRVNGIDPHREPDAAQARAALAVVSDAPVFYRDLTVREHVELVAMAHGVARGGRERAASLLDRLGLTGQADALPQHLSRGQSQRLQFACAFVRPFELLVLDEPLRGLDPLGRDVLRQCLSTVRGQGAAVLMVTHDPSFLQSLADRAIILEGGRIAVDGPYGDVLASPAAARLGVAPISTRDP